MSNTNLCSQSPFRHAITICLVALSFLLGNFLVFGDGVGYYFLFRQLRRGNWSLISDQREAPYSQHYVYLPVGNEWSVYSQIGTSLVWALLVPPFSILAHTPSYVRARVAMVSPPLPLEFAWDGFAILFTTSIIAYALIWVTLRWLMRETGAPEGRAWVATLLAFFGLPTWYYAFYDFSYPHIVELAFLVPALISFTLGVKKNSLRLIAVSGILVGCGALVRMDALLYAAVFAFVLWVHLKKARPCIAFLIPAVAVSSIQIIVWWHIFGTPLSSPYMLNKFVVPGVYAYHVLGGGLRGFFVWSPIALAGVVGLGIGLRAAATRMISLMGLALLVMYAIFYGSWSMWWAGSAAGQRFLIPLFPFVVYGLIIIFNYIARVNPRLRWSVVAIFVGAVVFSLFLSFTYPLLFQKGEKESSALAELLRTARVEYGFLSPQSFQRVLVRAFWHGPRVIHAFFPLSTF